MIQAAQWGRATPTSVNDVLFFIDIYVTLVTYRYDVKRGRSASWLFQDFR